MSRPHGQIIVWSQTEDWRRRRGITIVVRHPDGSESICRPLVFEPLPPDTLVENPTIDDGGALLQAMLDHAWEIGLRPRGFSDVPLQTAALKEHLNDMRALVFGRATELRRQADAARPSIFPQPGEG